MATRAGLLMLAATGLGTAAPAAAQDAVPVLSRVAPTQIAAILSDRGFGPQIRMSEGGFPVVGASRGGIHFDVYFYNCEGGTPAVKGVAADPLCAQLQFLARFEPPAVFDPAVVNAFNADRVFGSSYLAEDGDPVIEFAVTITGGVAEANLLANADLWEEILDDFTARIGW